MKAKQVKKTGRQADSPAKVLIADDDEATRILLRMALTQWGYNVVEASDGEEAWKILQQEDPPHLLTLDWLMPKLDGISLCKRIDTELSFRPYIIFLTRMGGTENVIQGLEAGADEFILKPFDLTELRIRIFAGERIIKYRLQLSEQNKQLRDYAMRLEAVAERYKNQMAAVSEFSDILNESESVLIEARDKMVINKEISIELLEKINALQSKIKELSINARETTKDVKSSKVTTKNMPMMTTVPPECIVQENESVINMKRMQAFFGKNNAAIFEFIQTFIALATDQVNEIDHAIKVKDSKSAKYYFHLLGSASGNSGMMRIYDICGIGEEKASQSDWVAAEECYHTLQMLINKLRDELSTLSKS